MLDRTQQSYSQAQTDPICPKTVSPRGSPPALCGPEKGRLGDWPGAHAPPGGACGEGARKATDGAPGPSAFSRRLALPEGRQFS